MWRFLWVVYGFLWLFGGIIKVFIKAFSGSSCGIGMCVRRSLNDLFLLRLPIPFHEYSYGKASNWQQKLRCRIEHSAYASCHEDDQKKVFMRNLLNSDRLHKGVLTYMVCIGQQWFVWIFSEWVGCVWAVR